MSPLEPPPDYINLPPPVSPLTTCCRIPGPFLPPQSEFSLALLRAPRCRAWRCCGASPIQPTWSCTITAALSPRDLLKQNARGNSQEHLSLSSPSFPQLPVCCQERGSTQHSKSFNPCSTAELCNSWFLSCFPSHGLGWCSHASCSGCCISQEYGNSFTSPLLTRAVKF